MDRSVMNTDCEQMLPPIPALTALSDKLDKAGPDCEGTLTVSVYRDYQQSLDSARLGLTRHGPQAAAHPPSGITAGDISITRTGLATYYVKYLRKSQKSANTLAAGAISYILEQFDGC
jgi:hypothetical protein